MNRREILKATILASIAAALAPVLGCLKRKSKARAEATQEVHHAFKMLVRRVHPDIGHFEAGK